MHWAEVAPERIFLAERDTTADGGSSTYPTRWRQVRSIGAALLARGLSPERPLMILSGNDIEHALIGLAAIHVGIPYAPISPAYSLVSSDFGKLRHIVGIGDAGPRLRRRRRALRPRDRGRLRARDRDRR